MMSTAPTLRRWLTRALVLSLAALGLSAAAQNLADMKPQKVGPNTWFVQGLAALGSPANQNFISNAGFVVAPQGVVVIDALGSPALARRLVQKIAEITPKPITHVIVTHYHADHIYGLQVFKELGAQIIAQQDAREYLNSETAAQRLVASRTELAPWVDDKTRLVPADRWLTGSTPLDLAGMRFVVERVGPSHTPEDLAIHVPGERVLFAGDLMFSGRLPFVGQADSGQWIASLDRLLRFDVAVVVPGHGAASTEPRKDMVVMRDYLTYLRTTMGKAAKELVPFDEAYSATDWSTFEPMPMFRFANRMNAYNTYLLMEKDSLGGR
jgi:glyoxylase-like metal-dependent hydrolase (beta-lactamase superfamily II)